MKIDIEGTQSYLAFVPLEDYGPCLQIDGDSPESAEKLYNDKSLPFQVSSELGYRGHTELPGLCSVRGLRCVSTDRRR